MNGGERTRAMAEKRLSPEEINRRLSYESNLTTLSEGELFDFICGTLLEKENEKYTAGNTAEHKLLFLIGNPNKNLSDTKTKDGSDIYTTPSCYPKAPEIAEATAAISAYFEVDHNVARAMSEIVDVFYNMVHLTKLDTDFANVYWACMERLSQSLGLSLKDIFIIAAVKYKCRLIEPGEKSLEDEDETIAYLLGTTDKPGVVRVPSDEGLGAIYGAINEVETFVLRPRLQQWQYMSGR